MSSSVTSRFVITGDVGAAQFPGWIRVHAAKLGLSILDLHLTNRGLGVEVTGPPEMVEALAIACSLGPAGVLVDCVI
jgi:hypothetical protein